MNDARLHGICGSFRKYISGPPPAALALGGDKHSGQERPFGPQEAIAVLGVNRLESRPLLSAARK